MEPTAAVRSIETALRLVIVEVLGVTAWESSPGAPDRARLEERRTEEGKRRDGAAVSPRLIDYTETYHLTAIIEKNWEKFQPAFKDKGRTSAYFGVLNDVRNSIAHSRELVPFERDLISGIAGHIRNQVSLFRSGRADDRRYYPLIESVRDNFGHEGGADQRGRLSHLGRLEVGDCLTFEGTAFNARGKTIRWQLTPKVDQPFYDFDDFAIDVAEGDAASFSYTVTEKDVHETFALQVRIIADSKYHRYMKGYGTSFDDSRAFLYSVNPPDDE